MALPQTFKAMVVSETAEKTFSREVRERALGDLPAGELIIEVKYSSLNYKDALSATGNKGVTRKYPHTPGIDAAGVVADSTTKLFTVGDQVTVTGFDLGMNTSGGFARYISVPALWATKLPQGLSLKDSMSHGTAGLTAALCIIRLMASGLTKESGEVLVTGASGGVGRFAIQLAKLGGAHVTAIARRTEGLQELGADEVAVEIDLEGPTYEAIVDGVGGPVLGQAIQRVAPGGTIVSFASTVTEPVSYPSRELFARAPGARVYGFYVFAELAHTRSGSADLRRLADLVADKRLDPQIDLTLPWSDAAQAIEALLDRRVNGKAVLTID